MAGRGGRSRVRRARAVRFPAGANIAQAFGHYSQAWAKYQCQSHARISKGTTNDSFFRVEDKFTEGWIKLASDMLQNVLFCGIFLTDLTASM
jgi:hypothetical protein